MKPRRKRAKASDPIPAGNDSDKAATTPPHAPPTGGEEGRHTQSHQQSADSSPIIGDVAYCAVSDSSDESAVLTSCEPDPVTDPHHQQSEDVFDDIQPSTGKGKQKNKKLLAEIKTLKKTVAMLEDKRDFLRETMKTMTCTGKSQAKKKRRETSSSSDDTDSSMSVSMSSESSNEEEKNKKKKKDKKHSHPLSKIRAQTPNDVLLRYSNVLKAYKLHGSMMKAFRATGIDRNTLALSAPLAEIMIVDRKFLKTIPPFEVRKEKLMDYIKRCSAALPADIRTKIENLKTRGKMLPITPKFR